MAKNNAKSKDARKVAQQMAPKKKEKRSIREYFRGVKLEMKKVIWPTKKELSSYTAIVVLVCAFFSVAFWLIDTGFLAALKGVLGITL